MKDAAEVAAAVANARAMCKTNTTLPKNLSDWPKKGPLKGTKPSAAMLKDEVKRRCPTARCDNWGMKTCVSWLFNTDSDAALVEDPAADSGGSPVATGPVRNSLYSFIHRTTHPCFRFASSHALTQDKPVLCLLRSC